MTSPYINLKNTPGGSHRRQLTGDLKHNYIKALYHKNGLAGSKVGRTNRSHHF